jgi:hypothetical protein
MVYPWKSIHGMEIERISLVDRREAYVLLGNSNPLAALMATGHPIL